MKLGFALARLSSKKSCGVGVQPAETFSETQEPAYTMLNDQTWTAVFSCLSTADLARSRVSCKINGMLPYAVSFQDSVFNLSQAVCTGWKELIDCPEVRLQGLRLFLYSNQENLPCMPLKNGCAGKTSPIREVLAFGGHSG